VAAAIFKSSCPMNVRYYPFDEQVSEWYTTIGGSIKCIRKNMLILRKNRWWLILIFSVHPDTVELGYNSMQGNSQNCSCIRVRLYNFCCILWKFWMSTLMNIDRVVCWNLHRGLTMVQRLIYCSIRNKVTDALSAGQWIDQFLGDITNYMNSTEWHLLSINAEKKNITYSCCPEPYPFIDIYIRIQRRPMFYVFNLILPCVLISGIAMCSFFMPSDSGEKVTLG
jgi:hypothetical protein